MSARRTTTSPGDQTSVLGRASLYTCVRLGVWTDSESRLKIGREKFAALAVPRSFLVGSDFCVDN